MADWAFEQLGSRPQPHGRSPAPGKAHIDVHLGTSSGAGRRGRSRWWQHVVDAAVLDVGPLVALGIVTARQKASRAEASILLAALPDLDSAVEEADDDRPRALVKVAAGVTFGDSLPDLRSQMRRSSWWVVLLATWVIRSVAQEIAGLVILSRPANETFVLAAHLRSRLQRGLGLTGCWQMARQEVALAFPAAVLLHPLLQTAR